MAQPILTQTRLLEVVSYDQDTGIFTWTKRRSNNARENLVAGSIGTNGRRYVPIDNKPHLAHRLAWLYVYGVWPEGNITPVDGDYLNCRLNNLKHETPAETARRGGGTKTSTSGIPGVTWDKSREKWVASVNRDYKQMKLGRFSTKEEAVAAIQNAGGWSAIIVPKEERIARAQVIATKNRQKRLWENTLKDAGGVTGWTDFDAFASDIGSAPKENHSLVAVDKSAMIGPGNFAWSEIEAYDPKKNSDRQRSEFPMKFRERELRKKFGIGLEEYQQMFKAQGGVCAICSETETASRYGKDLWLAVDHCHATGKIRGLLCSNCNRGIGCFGDDRERMANAIKYVDKHAAEPLNVVPFKKGEEI